MDKDDSRGSVTTWLHKLREDDSELATQELWRRYIPRLIGLARARLRQIPLAYADEEDVAIVAFTQFCDGMREGSFELVDRDDLWRVLVTLTCRRAIDLLRKNKKTRIDFSQVDIENIISKEPTPDAAVEATDGFDMLLGALDDQDYRTVLLLKLASHTNAEIATIIDRSERTVERRLGAIRERLIDIVTERVENA